MIGIIDYGAGNIRSVCNALDNLSANYFVSKNKYELDKAEKLIFPGVGEARSAMDALKIAELEDWLKNIKVPFLGICLGMQLLFEYTTERSTNCLSILKGTNNRFDANNLKVPHMGWNQVIHQNQNNIFKDIKSGENFYFVHSYFAPIVKETIGLTNYGIDFTSALNIDNYYGVQFHPEKSGKAGLKLLNNFIQLC